MRQGALTQPEFRALRRELYEKRCGLCERGVKLSTGKILCSKGKVFPYCVEDSESGFKLIEGVA